MGMENTELIERIEKNIKKYIDRDLEVVGHTNILNRCKEQDEKESRHVNAFQADLAIFCKTKEGQREPLVIIEVKGWKDITTHDVLIYSSKARKHKSLLPWLRYGMVWSSPPDGKEGVPMRFLKNNEALDFAYNFNNKVDEKFDDFFKRVLQGQIDTSKKFYGLLHNDHKTRIEYFNANIDFGITSNYRECVTGKDEQDDL